MFYFVRAWCCMYGPFALFGVWECSCLFIFYMYYVSLLQPTRLRIRVTHSKDYKVEWNLKLAAWSCLMGFKACWRFPFTKNHPAPTAKKTFSLLLLLCMLFLVQSPKTNVEFASRLVGSTNLHTFLVGAFFETPLRTRYRRLVASTSRLVGNTL